MESTDFQVIAYLLLFLGLGSSFIHYKSFSKAQAKVLVKSKFTSNKKTTK